MILYNDYLYTNIVLGNYVFTYGIKDNYFYNTNSSGYFLYGYTFIGSIK